jgi:hypothetical protein
MSRAVGHTYSRQAELMKKLAKIILPAIVLATAVFVARGSGHVPRQLLLISDKTQLSCHAGPVIAVIPIPVAIVLPSLEECVVSVLPQEHTPISSDPALPSLGDRSPPPFSLA